MNNFRVVYRCRNLTEQVHIYNPNLIGDLVGVASCLTTPRLTGLPRPIPWGGILLGVDKVLVQGAHF